MAQGELRDTTVISLASKIQPSIRALERLPARLSVEGVSQLPMSIKTDSTT
jgi:hypothetical protein